MIQDPEPRGWLSVVLETLQHEELTQLVVTMWANTVRKEEGDHRKHLREPSVHSLLRGEVCIGVGIAYQPKSKEEQNRTGGTRWAPPPTGMAKLNVDVDAVVSKGSNRGAIAAVAGDEAGRFLGASALVFKVSAWQVIA